MDNIAYNTFNFPNINCFGEKVFSIKKNEKDDFVDAENDPFECDNFIMFIKDGFFQTDLFYEKSNNIEFDEKRKDGVMQLFNVLIDNEMKEKYKDYITKNVLYMYPNEKDENFYIQIDSIKDIFYRETKNFFIVSIYSKTDDTFMMVDDMKSTNFNLIYEFFERNDLNDFEKNFIINAFQQREYKKDHPDKETEKSKDKDFDNFKDFMKKDDSDVSDFKISKEERKIFNPSSLKIIDGADDPNKELNNLIGMKEAKEAIEKLNAKVNYQLIRESRNIFDLNNANLHMCFYGNPGTGKTTVARIMTGVLYNMGYIRKNKCIEINANELKGSEIGQTAIKTKVILRNAKNKVLFIDEAYALNDNKDGFGQEAVDTIIKEMEDNKNNMVIIFAGYKREMQNFIKMNEGLKSRINRYIEFENYNTIELGKIFIKFLEKHNLEITTEALIKSMLVFKNMAFQENFSNGRFIRNYYEELEEEHALNTQNIEDATRLRTITLDDIDDKLLTQFIEQNKR